jgi:hypothetical protein
VASPLERLLDLLLKIWDVEATVAAGYQGHAASVYELVSQRLIKMRREELESRQTSSARGWNSFDKELFLYLPITTEGNCVLPVTTVNYAFPANGAQSLKKLKCGMFVVSGPFSRYEDLHAVGFRFESPEYNSVRHGFWHAQSIWEFKRKALPRYILPHAPMWIPTDTPALPLPVSEPAGLVAALLVSLYGPDEVLKQYGPSVVSLLS